MEAGITSSNLFQEPLKYLHEEQKGDRRNFIIPLISNHVSGLFVQMCTKQLFATIFLMENFDQIEFTLLSL